VVLWVRTPQFRRSGWLYTVPVNTFTRQELGLIRKLGGSAIDATLDLRESCPIHSVCTPLPVFRVYRDSEDTFVAEWNDFHRKGPRQSFRFDEVPVDRITPPEPNSLPAPAP